MKSDSDSTIIRSEDNAGGEIRITNVDKSFGEITAVRNVTLSIVSGQVFGLLGTNGAGKSTLLRLMAGVYRPDHGSITVDGLPVFDNPKSKRLMYFIPDELYFLPGSNAADMGNYMKTVYEDFQSWRFEKLISSFGIDRTRSVDGFSKGMKRQLAILLGLCAGTKYLLLDEAFDGLDPMMRQAVKSLLAEDMADRALTPVIASHNLRELEDICDHIGLLHKGGVLLSEDLLDIKLGISKVQCVFRNEADEAEALKGLRIVTHEKRGHLHTLVIRGESEEIRTHFAQYSMTFFELLPLTLEELFISETEAAGYDVKKILVD